jgi:TolA-binding protein
MLELIIKRLIDKNVDLNTVFGTTPNDSNSPRVKELEQQVQALNSPVDVLLNRFKNELQQPIKDLNAAVNNLQRLNCLEVTAETDKTLIPQTGRSGRR